MKRKINERKKENQKFWDTGIWNMALLGLVWMEMDRSIWHTYMIQ